MLKTAQRTKERHAKHVGERLLHRTTVMSSASRPADTTLSTSGTSAPPVDDELEKLLSREASAFQREVEVERILKAFKLKWVDISCIFTLLIVFYPVHMIYLTLKSLLLPKKSRRNISRSLYVRSTCSNPDALAHLILVIHPDKCPHPKAPEAFDLLKKVSRFAYYI